MIQSIIFDSHQKYLFENVTIKNKLFRLTVRGDDFNITVNPSINQIVAKNNTGKLHFSVFRRFLTGEGGSKSGVVDQNRSMRYSDSDMER